MSAMAYLSVLFLGLGKVDRLALGETHIGLAQTVAAAALLLERRLLAGAIDHLHRLHLHGGHEFHGLAHFGLGGFLSHAKHVLGRALGRARGLLRYMRREQHVRQVFLAPHANLSSSCFTAATVTSTLSCRASETGSTEAAVTTLT